MAKKLLLSCFLIVAATLTIDASKLSALASDRICGKWMSEKKNCIVQVYRDGNDFKAKLVWFDDSDEPTKPMEARLDIHNPSKQLRSRHLVGMNVLENLEYHPKTDSWENGMIYDAQTGRKWNSSASMTSDNVLKVTGYWHFKFIGRTMTFNRVDDADVAKFIAKN
ncbi:DUF2147 domain-containing protein [Mucilaginibacter robiniae]|uniref:DUF2147 domain-containing protein n=1 Tax=Mucilaginibacter robiniae TaxID=2728022 RepID=A0A7L5E1U7_9SPHI|nr:DUF2147 domain-containing protein [Mucilaginibacter robiniae]QJD95554.1 DUF2147 domain-containing protein [Mucilaginibacter robiniae]